MANMISNTIDMDKENIKKFCDLYGVTDKEKFSFNLIIPRPEEVDWPESWHFQHWGVKWDVSYFSVFQILNGDDFETPSDIPLPVYEKMAADGLEFQFRWVGDAFSGVGVGGTENGKIWKLVDLPDTIFYFKESNYDDEDDEDDLLDTLDWTWHMDENSNRCEVVSTKVIIHGAVTKKLGEDVYALPVRKMIESGNGSNDCYICKIPKYLADTYKEKNLEIDEFNDFLRCCVHDGENGLYLLSKSGKRITAVRDFDHSEPDKDGYIYYPVPASDLENPKDGSSPLTKEATAKWKERLAR